MLTVWKIGYRGQTPGPIKYEKSSDETSGVLTILDVKDGGTPSRFEYRIESLRKDGNDLLKAGSVISSDFSLSPITFTFDHKNVSTEVAETLHLLLATPNSTHTPKENGDTMFGTDIQRQPGESWSVHRDAVANYLSSENIEVKPDDVSGEATLEGVVDGKDARALKIATRLGVRQLNGKPGQAGPSSGRLDCVSTLLVPADPGVAANRSESTQVHTIMMVQGTVATGQQYTSDVVADEEAARSFELLTPKTK